MSEHATILFESADITSWLRIISENRECGFCEGGDVSLRFEHINDSDITPAHIVSLACLIEFLDRVGCSIKVPAIHTNMVSNYILNKLRFREYWSGNRRDHVGALQDNVLNLWRIVDNQKETYSFLVRDYLKRKFFQSKDLSAVQNSLIETYYNVFDHAQADDNAFTFVAFDEHTQKLHVATCDFGIGIATSVRKEIPAIESDRLAIERALEYKFTTKSKNHNKGMGLGNIKDACSMNDMLTIISGSGVVEANVEKVESYDNDFSFPGTLIYYSQTLSHFEEEEFLDNFEL